jgi:hypothetical protein
MEAHSPDIVEFSTILEAMKGHGVSDGAVTDEGVHFNLDDGRVLVITGEFVIALMRFTPHTLQ